MNIYPVLCQGLRIQTSTLFFTTFCFAPCLPSPSSALSLSATLLLGDGNDGQALLSWLEAQRREWLDFDSLSSVDPTITAKDVATNAEMLLAIEEDSDAADRVWSGSGVLGVCELVVG